MLDLLGKRVYYIAFCLIFLNGLFVFLDEIGEYVSYLTLGIYVSDSISLFNRGASYPNLAIFVYKGLTCMFTKFSAFFCLRRFI